MKNVRSILLAIALTLFTAQAQAQTQTDQTYPRLIGNLEYGFLAVLDHKIQFSQNNTMFDYVKDGGQDTLYPVPKLSLDFELDPHHHFTFMYQALTLTGQKVLENDIKQDNITFAKGTPMKFYYDFPFFRASYHYDFNDDPFEELAIGLSLQLRDAVIEFESLDGSQLVSKQNIGPVPIIKFRHRNWIDNSYWWWGSEIDGFYAPISILNGSTNNVIGAILDANLRFGYHISDRVAPYLNLRYVGGGGVGTSSEKENLGDGFSENWLHTVLLSVGMQTNFY